MTISATTNSNGASIISGLSSGFDWQSLITQLAAADEQGVETVQTQMSTTQAQLSAWQSFNTQLLSLKTAADSLDSPAGFNQFTTTMTSNNSSVQASTLLSATASSSASPGSYTVNVTNLAQAQTLCSNPFTSQTTALGSSYAGDIVINGKTATINATDSLTDVANTINDLNSGSNPSGVTASILNFGSNNYQLILTSDTTGASGMSLQNGSAANLVQQFGWEDNLAPTITTPITGGAQGTPLANASATVQSLLGLTEGESGNVTIGDKSVNINLSTMSLTDIKNAINAAAPTNVTASIVSKTVNGTTRYLLQIDGTQTFTDSNNILNTLGILGHGSSNVTGVVSGNSMTTNGSAISAATLLTNIDGYNAFTPGDSISLTGTDTSGATVNDTFAIQNSTTVQDLLNEIDSKYGNVLAYVTSTGQIEVDDLSNGGSLAVNLTSNIQASGSALDFMPSDANFGAAAGRQRQIVAGQNATIQVDGQQITNPSNTIDNVIPGVTLNLLNQNPGTTINLNVNYDTTTIANNIQNFVTQYNSVMSYISTQDSYNTNTNQTGGVLFGDGTLMSINNDLMSALTDVVPGVDSQFSTLGQIGINQTDSGQLTVNTATLTGFLNTNFNDISSLFAGQGVSSNSNVQYLSDTSNTKSGSYDVYIDRAATQASATGDVDLANGGASGNLSVTQGKSTATVSIAPTMSLNDIVNALNTQFSTTCAQSLAGSNQLMQSDGTTPISSTTTWNDISGTTLQQGDVISFTGTSSSGAAVQGSYTIGSPETDQVQGLLSAIENAYSGGVTATINTSGQIIVTADNTGNSQLALSITAPAGRGLDFGTILTSNAGGRVGQYAMNLTASSNDSNQLVITSNNYGSGGSFSISSNPTNYDQIIYSDTSNTTVSSHGKASITGATTWGGIYGAGASNGDTITISGTAQNGSAISGTYTIGNTSTDTVNGLLSAIESAYSAQGTNVSASVQNGEISIEDLSPGASPISLTLTANNEGGGKLNLGTINQSTERDLGLGLVNGTYSGFDVAGTIGGEAATGSGQVLTGNSGNTNTGGLSVLCKGTADATDAGTLNFTVGAAGLFDRALSDITDPYSGYLTYKETSLQSQITSDQNEVTSMNQQITQQTNTMTQQFVAMETAVSNLKAQGSWLAGQTEAAQSDWASSSSSS